jgi:hypothetical protein
MPLVQVKFFPEPREFTDDQIAELRAAGLLCEDVPEAVPPVNGKSAKPKPDGVAASAVTPEEKP